MVVSLPQGFQASGVHCGIKRNPAKEDLALIVSDRPVVAAGVYTKNLVCAAPVVLDRQRTPSDNIRVVVANSGNANACTGEQGDRDAATMAQWAAKAVGAEQTQALVLSTGIIGDPMPMGKIEAGIDAAAEKLACDEAALLAAARGFMTTDLAHKVAGREIEIAGQTVRVTGIAKGSGMIGPNMATMLSVVMTDAALSPEVAQAALTTAVDQSFNCTSVDGHMSTNDTVLLLASGAVVATPLDGAELARFQAALDEVCQELARAIACDGEGASHLVTIDIHGCVTAADARRIAKTVAESPLVKTAIAGADPNWGRIVSAAGYAQVAFRPEKVNLRVNDCLLYEQGQPIAFDAAAVSASIREQHETSIVLEFAEGNATARFWTCDMTVEYIHINADYHT
jgi:glutamate N-acetyltransferase/amino-acid N-acetyltransferase